MKMNPLLKKSIQLLSFAALVGTLQASTFVLDKARSSVEIDVKATGDSFTGKLNSYTAVIQGNKATKKPSKVTFNWGFADLKTGKDKRDKKMISWLENKTKGSFVLSSFTKRGDGQMWAKGNMTIHGVKQVVLFPAKVIFNGDKVTIRGSATIDTRKFNLPIIRMFGLLKVDPLVKVRFKLRGKLKG